MSLLGSIAGSFKARKVAKAAARLWQETVNYCLLAGHDVRWPESAKMLTNAYTLAVLKYSCSNVHKSDDHIGAVIVLGAQFTKDVLTEIWGRQVAKETVEKTLADFEQTLLKDYHTTLDRLVTRMKHEEAARANPELLFERGAANYLERIGEVYCSISGGPPSAPDKAEFHRAIARCLSY